MGRRQALLFHARERRRVRFRRAGLPVAEVKIPGPDGAIADPLTGTQADEPASLVMRIESFGSTPPTGVLIQTGAIADALRLTLAFGGTGSTLLLEVFESSGLTINSGAVVIDIDLSSGIHTYVVAVDPVTENRAKVYVDGVLFIDTTEVGAGFAAWADSANTWDYADTMIEIGIVDPLEIVLDKVPGIF